MNSARYKLSRPA